MTERMGELQRNMVREENKELGLPCSAAGDSKQEHAMQPYATHALRFCLQYRVLPEQLAQALDIWPDSETTHRRGAPGTDAPPRFVRGDMPARWLQRVPAQIRT